MVRCMFESMDDIVRNGIQDYEEYNQLQMIFTWDVT